MTKTKLFQCPICLGKILHKAKINSCQHQFCTTCIRRWAKVKNCCPICQRRFSNILRPSRRIKRNKNPHENNTEGPLEMIEELTVMKTSTTLNDDDLQEQQIFHMLTGRGTRSGQYRFLGLLGIIQGICQEQ